jgi:all-trans-retinol 13,14-reductase
MQAEREWDFINIGAGITSLAFAAEAVMRQPGIRPLVLEKHLVAGGYASNFSRPLQDAVFDCSLHKLSGMRPGGNLHRIFQNLGLLDRLELIYPSVYFNASFEGTEITLSNNLEEFSTRLRLLFPEEREGLDAVLEEILTHGKDAYFQFQIQTGEYDPDLLRLRHAHQHLRPLTVMQGMRRHINHPRLLDILCASCIYVGALPEELGYLYYLHILYATLVSGNAYIRGGSQHLSDTLVDAIKSAGGEVLTKEKVEEILIDDQLRAIGVRTKKNEFHAHSVFINAAPQYALNNLFSSSRQHLEKVYEKVSNLKPSMSTTTVYLVIDAPPEDLGLVHSETIFFNAPPEVAASRREHARHDDGFDESVMESMMEEAYWQSSPMEVTNYHKLDKDGGYVVILNVLDEMKHWPQRKTPEYRAKKKRVCEALVQRLIERKPDFMGRIRYTEVSSPHTYRRYTNNDSGAGYGAHVGPGAATAHHFHHRFPIAGVHFLSAWVAGPSYEAAFGYAEAKARNLFHSKPNNSSSSRMDKAQIPSIA